MGLFVSLFPQSLAPLSLTICSHINSIDKFPDGNYLISGRHVKTIYKINATDGSIIWQLGGMNSDFTMDYEFNFQHHARFRAINGSVTTISLYDNGSDDSPPSPGQTKPGYEPYSSGIVAIVNETDMSSTLTERYVDPQHKLSDSQGDLQFLPNGNKFMGMGALPFAIEFTDNSTGSSEVVFYANLANSNGDGFSSYRNFKFNWTAQPTAPPTLFAYAQNCSTAVVFYASWNGATEVATWRLSAFESGTSGPMNTIGFTPKTGFETMVLMGRALPGLAYVAEAMAADGTVLGQSAPTEVFVPATSMAGCGANNCGAAVNYVSAANITCPAPQMKKHKHRPPPYSSRAFHSGYRP